MAHRPARKISTKEIAVRLREELDELYNDDMVSARAYKRKREFVNVLQAINEADRELTRDINLEGSTIAYVPAETSNLIFSNQHLYVPEFVESLSDKESDGDIITDDYVYFLGENQYLDVIEILDRYLYVYDEYPVNEVQSTSRIRKISESDYMGIENRIRTNETAFWNEPYFEDKRQVDAWCYYMVDQGRLHMNKKFESGKFLKFKARLMPGIVSMGDITADQKNDEKWDIYTIRTPHWGYEALRAKALVNLLPISAENARGVAERREARAEQRFYAAMPSDTNVIVPHHSI